MRILVCAKQVPDTNEVKIDPKTGTMIREGVPSILNPDDANALEAALVIKDENPGTEVIVMTMGPPQASEMLRECLAMGADEAYLLSDRAFGGADTWATSATLAAGIKKVKKVDLVLAGRQAIDGDTAQVGSQIAQRLKMPVVTYVEDIKIEDKKAIVHRQMEDGYEVIEVQLPCLLTCVKELNDPRYMSVGGIMDAYEQPITIWNHEDIGLSPEACGLNASPTQVFRSFSPPAKGGGEMITGTTVNEVAGSLVSKLKEKHII
ncbi:caffeyl-CoA reductase-Etf complex subunit CarD [Acetobacterium woodii]|uniref:Caffeyl-CoA reductase-Etf complex subunit CarD n=1 Tax=Acetobacterium woodii (strain ATCC 29683 / DSM 1030 / JCM 2381 / KCTC 1655 / WB1) TaxID=931626 RepID=CARD_ACEWD|nr:caffeyl-CoA reductase-Etf complex subunit CarD [Acetobacterium woodii]H6LGM7.1 RecName: Full=Caffeyl-CoA reductase-Etf complex subunit CarD; AltName: Full=Electron transfer flavoprotein small subunit; Short=ETFSS; AltName: Full=Electron transfer flavoprotein subunit beta; Short=Beta-ETF [Acetobacterium woodii DSM 1030]AFA48355.1 electron transfer flavoprotein beta subunit CarD [Acetobacterium woodii DSM 1030]6FAH_B Chain B, Caffeyl-CoA reductase-Etf complex subunit CarD [Acetobacterium woodii